MLSEISQKKMNTIRFCLCGIQNKPKRKKLNKNRFIDTENKLVVAREEGNAGTDKTGEGD